MFISINERIDTAKFNAVLLFTVFICTTVEHKSVDTLQAICQSNTKQQYAEQYKSN